MVLSLTIGVLFIIGFVKNINGNVESFPYDFDAKNERPWFKAKFNHSNDTDEEAIKIVFIVIVSIIMLIALLFIVPLGYLIYVHF